MTSRTTRRHDDVHLPVRERHRHLVFIDRRLLGADGDVCCGGYYRYKIIAEATHSRDSKPYCDNLLGLLAKVSHSHSFSEHNETNPIIL
jgi:hypothetical protein